jgi:rhodanese-related sulfurtransferase
MVVSPVPPAPIAVVTPEDEPEPPPDIEVDAEQLRAWVSEGQDFVLIDIREPHELQSGYADGALLLRMNDIPNRLDELPPSSTRLVVYCAAGMRSYGVTHWLREQGWADAWSLSSGLHGAVEAGFGIARPE